jgi:hypothetical protein
VPPRIISRQRILHWLRSQIHHHHQKCGLIIVQQRMIDWINYNHKQIVSAIAYIMHKSSNMYEIIATVLNWCIWYE